MSQNPTCGQCKHARPFPPQAGLPLTNRLCYGGPPTPVLVPTSQGTMTIQAHYPPITVADPACGIFAPKFVLDIAEPLRQDNKAPGA